MPQVDLTDEEMGEIERGEVYVCEADELFDRLIAEVKRHRAHKCEGVADAVLAERERCAKAVESWIVTKEVMFEDEHANMALVGLAEEIRKGV